MDFKEKLSKWVNLDNQIKQLNENIKELRNERNNLENEITIYSNENNLININIPLNDGKLRIVNTKVNEPITFKYLEKTLEDIIQNEEQIKIIMEHIRQNRESKVISEIKRYYK